MTSAHIVAVVQLPPPVTGLSAVNEQMVARLADSGKLKAVIDVAPPAGARGVGKHLARLARTVRAALALVRARWAGATTLYMPSDGGAGMIWNILILAVARPLGYRLWMHHHNYTYINDRSWLMWLQLWIAPRATRHIALCQTMLEALQSLYSKVWSKRDHSGLVLSNAFMVVPQTATTPRTGPLVIGHLSNLTAEKGAVRFVDLFLAARADGLDVTARIAGPIGDLATQSAIEGAARDHGNRFEWVGPVYGADKARFYGSIDAFVFPSDYPNEAQPLVLLEALAGGAAVLVTARGCMACDHANSPGLVAPLNSFHETAMEWLRDHSALRSRQETSVTALKVLAEMNGEAAAQLAAVVSEI